MDQTLRPDLDALLEGLNPPQAQAVRQMTGPVMLVAGPGSGKTRVLTHRVAALLASGTPPGQILAVTFTNKAAREMKERLETLIGPLASRVWVSTFHSLCVRLLRNYAHEAGLPANFTIADQDDVKKIFKEILPGYGLHPDDAKRYRSAVSWAKNNLQTPENVESDLVRLAEVFDAYQKALSRQGLLDFDDLLTLTHRLLSTNLEVRELCAQRFRFVMVDEYQDTNRVQYEIVRLLSATHRNLFVVGDADQSIYRFRGAFAAAIEGFTDDFPETVVIKLDQNYRSTKRIVDVSRALIEANPAKHRGELWTDNHEGALVRLIECADDRQEAGFIASEIQKLSGTKAVIVRTNAQTKAFETEFSARKMAYDVVGTQRFYDRAEIKDSLAWLRIVLNPADVASLRRAASTPRRGLGDKSFDALVALAQTHSLTPLEVAAIPELQEELPTRTRSVLAGLSADVAAVRVAAEASPAHAIRAILDLGLRSALSGEPERLGNVEQLLNEATSFTLPEESLFDDADFDPDDPLALTRAFVETAMLASAADQGARGDLVGISLITAHASKGREFDHVFVAGVEESVYPHRLVGDDPAEIAEERRLLFVATSRAKVTLTISWCRRRMVFGNWEDSAPSPFLIDLPDHVEERCIVPGSSSKSSPQRPIPGRPGQRASYHPPRSTTRSPSSIASRPRFEHPLNQAATFTPPAPEQLGVGVRVTHPSFGEGVVIEAATPTQVRIDFSGTPRTLVLAFAHLTIVSPSEAA